METQKTREYHYKLVQGCIEGNVKFQNELYNCVYNPMINVCRRYTKDLDTAKDICQQGFIKVFKNLNNFKFEGSFEGWAKNIVKHIAIDYFKKQSKHHMEELKFISNTGVEDLNFEEIKNQKLKASRDEIFLKNINTHINQLTPAYRSVIELYAIKNKKHREIAEMLNISVGTSKSNLMKARKKLQLQLQNI